MVDVDRCIFCRIVRGEAPAYKIYEDAEVVVFMDAFPVTDGHTLVITREHFESLFETRRESLQAVAAISQRVARAIKAELKPDGLMIFQLNGMAAGQSVFHYHMHLMPRAQGEPLTLHSRAAGDPERLRELSQRIAARLED